MKDILNFPQIWDCQGYNEEILYNQNQKDGTDSRSG
jgi:hypothetical protein